MYYYLQVTEPFDRKWYFLWLVGVVKQYKLLPPADLSYIEVAQHAQQLRDRGCRVEIVDATAS